MRTNKKLAALTIALLTGTSAQAATFPFAFSNVNGPIAGTDRPH